MNGMFKYLDMNIKIINDNTDIIISHHHKNTNNILLENKQKYLKYTHWDSYTPISVKRGIVIGMFHRIMANASRPAYIIGPTIEFINELLILNYPKNIIMKIIEFTLYNLYTQLYTYTAHIDKIQMILLNELILSWNEIRFKFLNYFLI
jgi:hypothetical protein